MDMIQVCGGEGRQMMRAGMGGGGGAPGSGPRQLAGPAGGCFKEGR